MRLFSCRRHRKQQVKKKPLSIETSVEFTHLFERPNCADSSSSSLATSTQPSDDAAIARVRFQLFDDAVVIVAGSLRRCVCLIMFTRHNRVLTFWTCFILRVRQNVLLTKLGRCDAMSACAARGIRYAFRTSHTCRRLCAQSFVSNHVRS